MMRVGYCMNEKKAKKLLIQEFEILCRNDNIELIKISLEQCLEEQGPFDLIFHKLTDQIVRAGQGYEKETAMIRRLESYLAGSPRTVVIDPLASITQLLDRHEQYRHVAECSVLEEDCCYFCPSFVEFTSTDIESNKTLMEEHGVQYPFVCKSSYAHGSSQSHKMALIFNESGLRDISLPCVAQTFINHNAMLVKVFVIGDRHHVVQRPSIKNLSAGDFKTIFFDSHDVSKADSDSFLNQCDDLQSPITMPDPKKVNKLVNGLRQKLNLSLFGIDIIIENHTGRYGVIDINPFPSYVGVPNFFGELLHLIKSHLTPSPSQSFHHLPDSQHQNNQDNTQHSTAEDLTLLERQKEEQAADSYSRPITVPNGPIGGPVADTDANRNQQHETMKGPAAQTDLMSISALHSRISKEELIMNELNKSTGTINPELIKDQNCKEGL